MTKTRAQPVKVFCNMHDVIFNSNTRKMEQAENGKIACPCCNRFTNPVKPCAFELPEAQGQENTPSCNCFFGTIENGSHTKDEIEQANRFKSLAEAVKDSEESTKDFNESCNANKCRIHGDCENPNCEGITICQ